MIVKRFYDDKLAQASYLIGCGRTGSAVVIDANRDVEQYVRTAVAEGVRITHVTETHIHADYVSGSRELAARTGATLYLSDEGDADWKYAFAKEAGAVLLKDGDSFMVGNVEVEAVHTPGHTPEHLSFLITDTARAAEPIAIVSGDFVFVGDVGRPDLLEKAAGVEGTMEPAARKLFGSLERFKRLPDWLQVWPGHGSGSACGKGLSAVPQSTVGYERRFNWAFEDMPEHEFVARVLAGQPEPPVYFAEMKRINQQGPRILGGLRRPERLSVDRLAGLLETEALVIDTRDTERFATGHVPGTINIPLDRSFTTWAGWLVPYDRDFYLIVDDRDSRTLDEAVRDLVIIGLDRVAGWLGAGVVSEWGQAGRELGTLAQTTPRELAERRRSGEVAVLDVRSRAEWEAAHLPGVENIPLGYLVQRLAEVPRDKPVVLHCQAGGRSAIAASLLRAKGLTNVVNLAGGIAGWEAAGLPVESGWASGELVSAP